MKLSEDLGHILAAAYHEAKNRSHEYLTPEHILYASLFFDSGAEIILHCGGDVERLKRQIQEHFESSLIPKGQKDPAESLGFQSVLERAVLQSASAQKETVEIGDVLAAIFEEKDSFAAYFMQNEGLTRLNLLNYIAHGISAITQTRMNPWETAMNPKNQNQRQKTGGQNPSSGGALEAFSVELTALAKEKESDPLIGREEVLERVMRSLCRRYKNNPLLIGEPGVGKTAVALGLASLIVKGQAPEPLLKSRIFSLDLGGMLAGTKYRGDFEERFKKVLSELSRIPGVILFIDEIHTLVGAGAVQGGAMDASHLLKPVLTSGTMRCIGATTYEEHKKYFEKDRALSRRFQKIELSEPSVEETVQILEGLKERYEQYHEVSYTPEALRAAAELSAKYLYDRHLPDKAIDLLDEAGAHARMYRKPDETLKVIDAGQIEKIIAGMAKIPEKTVSESDTQKLKNLESELKTVVFGQDEAVSRVCAAIKTSRAGFREPEKPIASFLFVGPTGVGKTELARQLAKSMGVPLHRFDMSEYEEKHTVARLIGAPPGYVGFDQGGLLTDTVTKHPHSVVLLDEIEKAHPDIFNILLQVMDYATLTDNNGKKADFRNVILIMTSNAGAREIGKSRVGFHGETESFSGALKTAVDKAFSPEFRNRLDGIVPFAGLSLETVTEIVKKFLKQFEEQLAAKRIEISFSAKVYRWLAEKSYSPVFGARETGRLIQDLIKTPFIDETLFGRLSRGGKARVSIKKDQVEIQFEEPAR